jgi:CubicO group peptidase (beta-lactamase class C family)
VGRCAEQVDRRAVAGRHHGADLVGDKGIGGDDAGARPLPRLARLRGARLHLLAGVCAAGQGGNHGPAAPGSQAGLFAFNEPVDKSVVADLDRLAIVLARQKPAWEPGTRQAYHALTLGFYEGELLRRIDPQHRSLGHFFQDEIATPLGLEVYIRLPETIPNSRLATLASPSPLARLFGFPIRLTLDSLNPRSSIHRALIVNPGTAICEDERRIYARSLEVPSGGGVGTARAIARAYGVFATDGRELRLRAETLEALSAPAIPPTHGFYDECFRSEVQFSLGFMKPSPFLAFGSNLSFGAPGAGGAMGFADPKTGIGYAYVTSRMGTSLTGDPRDLALRNAISSIIPLEP